MKVNSVYRISFVNGGKVYEIYARHISTGSLFGFVEVEDILFGERQNVVIDPSEERLQKEFAGVRRSYLPMHSVLRIDEVEKQGTAKISDLEKGSGATVTPFPIPVTPS